TNGRALPWPVGQWRTAQARTRGRAAVKVLLADDDPDTLDITAYALRREGFIVSVASDGREALRMWESNPPDIILLDVRMPKLNGFELLRTIRQHSSVPIIMVTARGDDDDVVRGL